MTNEGGGIAPLVSRVTPMHESEGKRLPAVKVILHQLAKLTGA